MIAEGGGAIHFLYAQKQGTWKMLLFTVTPRGVVSICKGSFLEMSQPRQQEILNSPLLYSPLVLKDSLIPFRMKGQISEIWLN